MFDEHQRRMSNLNNGEVKGGEVRPLIANDNRRQWFYYQRWKQILCVIVAIVLSILLLASIGMVLGFSLPTHTVSTSTTVVNLLNSISPVTLHGDILRCCDSGSQLMVNRSGGSLLEYSLYSGSCYPNTGHVTFQQPVYISLFPTYWGSVDRFKWLGPSTSLTLSFDIICLDADDCIGSNIVLMVINQDQTKDCKYGGCSSKPLDSNRTIRFTISELPPNYYFIYIGVNGTSNVLARWAVSGTYGNYTLNSNFKELCQVRRGYKDECVVPDFKENECIFIHTSTVDPTASPWFYHYDITLFSPSKEIQLKSIIVVALIGMLLVVITLYFSISGYCACKKVKFPHQTSPEGNFIK